MTSAPPEKVHDVFVATVDAAGWSVIQRGDDVEPSVVRQGGPNPVDILCSVLEEPDAEDRRSVLVAVSPATYDNLGRSTWLGGMTGQFLETRGIQSRFRRFDERLHATDPHLMADHVPSNHPPGPQQEE